MKKWKLKKQNKTEKTETLVSVIDYILFFHILYLQNQLDLLAFFCNIYVYIYIYLSIYIYIYIYISCFFLFHCIYIMKNKIQLISFFFSTVLSILVIFEAFIKSENQSLNKIFPEHGQRVLNEYINKNFTLIHNAKWHQPAPYWLFPFLFEKQLLHDVSWCFSGPHQLCKYIMLVERVMVLMTWKVCINSLPQLFVSERKTTQAPVALEMYCSLIFPGGKQCKTIHEYRNDMKCLNIHYRETSYHAVEESRAYFWLPRPNRNRSLKCCFGHTT